MYKKWIPLDKVDYDDLYRVVDDMFSIQGMKILKKDQYNISVEIVSFWDNDIVADDIIDLSCIYAGDDAIDAHAMTLTAEDYQTWNQFLMAKGHHRCYMLLEDNPYLD